MTAREEELLADQLPSLHRRRHLLLATTWPGWVEDAALRSQELEQPRAGAGEPLAIGRRIDRENRRGLVARERQDLREDERDPKIAIQTEQHRLRASQADFACEQLAFGLWKVGLLIAPRAVEELGDRVERDPLHAPPARAQEVVRGDAPAPRPERAFATERAEVREDDEENLLRRVLRILRVPEHSEREPVGPILDREEKPLGRSPNRPPRRPVPTPGGRYRQSRRPLVH